jgi:hypothetical protein
MQYRPTDIARGGAKALPNSMVQRTYQASDPDARRFHSHVRYHDGLISSQHFISLSANMQPNPPYGLKVSRIITFLDTYQAVVNTFFPAAYGQYCHSLLSLSSSLIGKFGVKGLMDVGILRFFLDNVLLVCYIVTLRTGEA